MPRRSEHAALRGRVCGRRVRNGNPLAEMFRKIVSSELCGKLDGAAGSCRALEKICDFRKFPASLFAALAGEYFPVPDLNTEQFGKLHLPD